MVHEQRTNSQIGDKEAALGGCRREHPGKPDMKNQGPVQVINKGELYSQSGFSAGLLLEKATLRHLVEIYRRLLS